MHGSIQQNGLSPWIWGFPNFCGYYSHRASFDSDGQSGGLAKGSAAFYNYFIEVWSYWFDLWPWRTTHEIPQMLRNFPLRDLYYPCISTCIGRTFRCLYRGVLVDLCCSLSAWGLQVYKSSDNLQFFGRDSINCLLLVVSFHLDPVDIQILWGFS